MNVQLFAQLEKDCKGGEDESSGNVWYKFACLHKVRILVGLLVGVDNYFTRRGKQRLQTDFRQIATDRNAEY